MQRKGATLASPSMPWNSQMRRRTVRKEGTRSLPAAPEGAGKEQR